MAISFLPQEQFVAEFPAETAEDQAVGAVILAGKLEESGSRTAEEIWEWVRSKIVEMKGRFFLSSGVDDFGESEALVLNGRLREALQAVRLLTKSQILRKMADNTLPEPTRGLEE